MFLYINTSSHEKIVLTLLDKRGKILKWKDIKAPYQQAEKLLMSINNLVSYTQSVCLGETPRRAGWRSMSKIKGVIVVSGPGSFTSLRIGVATANAMAWALNVPVVDLENKNNESDVKLLDKSFQMIKNKRGFTKQVLPKYGKEANISK